MSVRLAEGSLNLSTLVFLDLASLSGIGGKGEKCYYPMPPRERSPSGNCRKRESYDFE
jgi:hypothetical protein